MLFFDYTDNMTDRIRRHLTIAALAFALLVTLFGPIIAFAGDASACYNVADADARSMCLARAHREPGQCYSIQRADLRSQCLAEVRK